MLLHACAKPDMGINKLKYLLMNELLDAAYYYKSLGFSVIAVRENKKSLTYWKCYQKKIISDFGIDGDFGSPDAWGIAIVCGKVSGNLEIIDLDGKNDGTLYERFSSEIKSHNPHLFSSLVIASTRNSGYHFFYRCNEVGRHTVLAKRPCSEEELKLNPNSKAKTLIEKLGEDSYGIISPSPGYKFVQGVIEEIPLISPIKRNQLITIAQSFNKLGNVKKTDRTYYYQDLPELSPLNDYDARGDFIHLLEHHGWKVVRTKGPQIFFRRPGDTDHDTSGDFHQELGLFTVFTPNTEFTPYIGYRPHAIYAVLECDSDFKTAAKRLLQMGYGVPYRDRY